MLISALKVLLQDSVFAGGRSLEDKIAAAQVLVDRVMQKANGVTGEIDWTGIMNRVVQYKTSQQISD